MFVVDGGTGGCSLPLWLRANAEEFAARKGSSGELTDTRSITHVQSLLNGSDCLSIAWPSVELMILENIQTSGLLGVERLLLAPVDLD